MRTELVRIPTTPERCAEIVAVIVAARTGYLAAPRCVGLRILRADDDTAVVALIDWASREANAEAAAGEDAAALFAAIGPLASGPPESGWYVEASRGSRRA